MPLPVIDPVRTGLNIKELMKKNGVTAKDLTRIFFFSNETAVYKWLRGATIPSVENLLALSMLFGIPINDILIQK